MDTCIQPVINFNHSFKIRLGHKKLPFTDLNRISDFIFSSYDKDELKRFMGFVEENCHIHIFLEFKNKICDTKACETMRKMLYKEIKYLANEGQGGQNPISITPYRKYRKQEYAILEEKIQLLHQVCYITKDANIHACACPQTKHEDIIKSKHVKHNITTREIKSCKENYYNNYRKIIQYFEKLKVNKKIKNKTNKQQFIDYIESNQDSMTGQIGLKLIPRIVAQYYIEYPHEHTPHNIKMKTYYVLSKYYPDHYKKLIIQQLNNEILNI